MKEEQPEVNPSSRYSISKAAATLGVSRKTLYSYIHRGRIKANKRVSTGKYYITGIELLRAWSTPSKF